MLLFGFCQYTYSDTKRTPGSVIDAIESLPMGNMKAIETNGEIVFVSQNGRFVIRGQLHDSWQRKKLETMNEMVYAINHIDVKALGLKPDNMNTLTIKGGDKEVYAFVDPQCEYCKHFIKEARSNKEQYTFHIVVVPALGDESDKLARRIFCAANKDRALDAMIGNQIDSLDQKSNCDMKLYDYTLMIATLFEFKSVPFFIAPDYRYKVGAGAGFWNWLGKS
jgi:thiol:disulfide interchange protein DsbC